ncbi:MAG: LysR family transcriptional regulator [Synechococcales cyanobacterium C42_A2020_086]|jgi:DNA-binding transcriptional LysR family regulator|nr:LysR family transcriptional regulator [Synechococcales cyanobacterium M58_A2018_015]MBF2073869.1 LysR family transcriptional regulator [Synechococcales cyanobacterium C42_A2020_086]
MNGMSLENIKLSQLRTLVAVAESGNFSEAALELGVSQSAVSHAIATLEEELGVVLMARGRHGATLTPVGERVLGYARDMLRLLETIGKEANLAKGLQSGQVRIASFRSAATHVLPGVIAEFHKRYPGIAITIMEYRGDDGVEQSLKEGRSDIGLSCTPTSIEFESWELMRDEYVALFPPDAPIPEVITWDDLRRYPLIMPPPTDYCSILIRGHLTSVNQPLQATYEIMEDSTIVSMVMQGLGATIIARLAAEPLPSEVQVRRLPVPLERIIRVALLASALHPPAVYAFLDTLRSMTEFSHQEPAPAR